MVKVFSKIRKKLLLLIFAALLMAFCVVGLIACTHEDVTEEDLRPEYPIKVTYDYQGGYNPASDKPTTEILIREGNPIPNPSNENSKLSQPRRTGYSFKCFCEAKKGVNGEYLLDENGKYIEGEVWDFTTVPTSDTVLLAQWWDNFKLVLHYGENFKHAEEVLIPRDRDGNPGELTIQSFTVSDFTFLNYYYDSALTQKIDSVPIPNLTKEMFESSQDKLTLDVYGDGLEGNFVIVRSVSDMSRFTGNNSNLYLDVDVDMSKYSGTVKFPSSYNGTIIGNGHVIENITIADSNATTNASGGLFATINGSACIKDVTFTNVNYSISMSNPGLREAHIGLFAGTVQSGAVIENVHISGSLAYEIPSGFLNTDNVVVNGFIANNNASGTVKDSAATSVDITHSSFVFSADQKVIIYFTYKNDGGNVSIVDVYGTAYMYNNAYSTDRVITKVKNDDGSYKLTAVNNTYDVTVSYVNGEFTTTVTFTENE